MKRFSLLLPTLLLAPAAADAQTKTLPRGLENKEGNFWQAPGWSIQGNVYLPARVDYSYEARTFPWDPKRPRLIVNLRARLDSVFAGPVVAHRKEVALWMSVDGFDPATPPMNFQRNATHGKNRRLVMTRKWINYPASPRSSPAPFQVVFKLTAPYLVPANSRNLIIQYNVYRADKSSNGLGWRVDSEEVQRSFDFGRRRTVGRSCPSTIRPSTFPAWAGGDLNTLVATGLRRRPVIGWLGVRRVNPIQFPGTQCFLYVDPLVVRAVVTEPNHALGRGWFWWGRVPKGIVNAKVSVQYAVLQPGYPLFGSIGMSAGVEVTIGSGWQGDVPFSSIASFGQSLDPPSPDTTRIGNWLNTRVPVWEIQP